MKQRSMSAHTKSAMKLQKLEDSFSFAKKDKAKSFIATMRRKGDKEIAATRKKCLGAMTALLT